MVELGSEQVRISAFLSVTIGILVLFVGKALNARLEPLRRYNIPEPVTGGLLVSIAIGLAYFIWGVKVDFDLAARDILLVYFFTAIGINAEVGDLVRGGKPLVILLSITVGFMLLENVAGVSVAYLLGIDPSIGLLAGSVSMTGGHGTAIAWAPVIASDRNLPNAMEIGVVCATIGLILASLAGGPTARFLIQRYGLRSAPQHGYDVSVPAERVGPPIDYHSFLHAILALHVAGIIGIIAHRYLEGAGIKVPLFLPCLASGIVLTNLVGRLLPADSWPSRTPALALISEVALGVFLAMSLMSMKLWTLATLAGPVSILLLLQLILAVAVAIFICFPLLGRNYDAAVMSSGFIGFGLGATPTAMANMTAVTQRHGPSHVAFLVVPLVGAFFIDIANTVIIRLFLAAL